MAPEGKAHFQDLFRVHLAVAGFGFAGVFGKLLSLPPVTIVAGRAGFAALVLALFLLWKPEPEMGVQRGIWWSSLLPGVLLAGHWWMFFQAVQISTVAVALVSYSTFPLLVMLWEALGLGKPLALRDLCAALAALAGVAVIVPRFDLSDASLRGALWGSVSGAAFAVMVLWNRVQAQRGSPWGRAMVQNAVACLVLLPFALAKSVRPTVRDWLILACLGLFFTAATHGLFIRSLRSIPAKLASLVCTLEPVYGILAGILVLREIPSFRTLLGAVLVISAVVLVTLGQGNPNVTDIEPG